MNRSKVKELLAVLDLPKDSPEQYGWLLSMIREQKVCCPADLAFRLRDEVENINKVLFRKAIFRVYTANGCSLCGQHEETTWVDSDYKVFRWFGTKAKPIHFIIAALIAKELAKDEIRKNNKT